MSATIYTTNLTKEECLLRLQKHTDRGGWIAWVEGTIAAKVCGDRFRLFAWGPANVRNSLSPFFYGRIEADSSVTRLRGHFRFHPITRGFLVIWFGGLLIMDALILLLPPSAWGSGRPPPVYAVLGPAGMMLLGYVFIRVCQRIARGQVESLRNFLEHELQAQPQVEGSPNHDP